MSGMTVSTVNACNWQYQKYKISITKWQQVEDCLKEEKFNDYSTLVSKLQE
jgi:hypothetical protein